MKLTNLKWVLKVSIRYVDDILGTVSDVSDIVLQAEKKLHQNLVFNLKKLDNQGMLAFLDLKINNFIIKLHNFPLKTSVDFFDKKDLYRLKQ